MRAGRTLAAGVLALQLVACAASPSPSSQGALASKDPAAVCLSGLDQRHIQYRRLQDWGTPGGCGVAEAVEVDRSALPWNRVAPVTCPMAGAIWDFETKVVIPEAKRLFGRSVARLNHFGTYSCRGVNGASAGRLSEHARGQAIDISGFDLDDGTKVSVLRDWGDPGPKGAFLHAVAQGACSIFSMVLTPSHDSMHDNHIHLDIGPYKLCGI